MKHFLVTLKMNLGEYEKFIKTLVSVSKDDKQHAMNFAMKIEAHNDLIYEPNESGSLSAWDDWMVYTPTECKPVEEEDLATLRKYFTRYTEADHG